MEIAFNIKCDNAAFAEDNCGNELARILRALAHRADQCPDGWALDGAPLMDSNGNRVGRVTVVDS